MKQGRSLGGLIVRLVVVAGSIAGALLGFLSRVSDVETASGLLNNEGLVARTLAHMPRGELASIVLLFGFALGAWVARDLLVFHYEEKAGSLVEQVAAKESQAVALQEERGNLERRVAELSSQVAARPDLDMFFDQSDPKCVQVVDDKVAIRLGVRNKGLAAASGVALVLEGGTAQWIDKEKESSFHAPNGSHLKGSSISGNDSAYFSILELTPPRSSRHPWKALFDTGGVGPLGFMGPHGYEEPDARETLTETLFELRLRLDWSGPVRRAKLRFDLTYEAVVIRLETVQN